MVKHLSDKEIDTLGQKYNRIFTSFQKLDKKVLHWEPLREQTKDKWELMLIFEQIQEMRAQRWAFIILTVAIIIMMILQIFF